MNKLEEIFTAWGISFNPNDVQSNLAAKRINICNSCEHKKTNLLLNTCSLCGCALKAKVFTPITGACPAGKWDEVDNTELVNGDRNLRFICAQPATDYYVWQVEVMIDNFIQMGVDPNNIDIVCQQINGEISDNWMKLATTSPARFFFYNDTRVNKNYISSIRPNILKQHFEQYPELKKESIFYHDCDIVFTKPIKNWITSETINDDNWYGSDTRWYIGHDYIKSKGEDVLHKMCEIVDIDVEIVRKNELNSIGAQYIMKRIDSTFWHNVETNCEKLFKEITELNNDKIELDRHTMPENEVRQPYHPLQIWCADMWAVLWEAWKRGQQTIPHKKMNFAWATGLKVEWDRCNIFHNAGVTKEAKDLFNKTNYINKLPYTDEIEINENSASFEYWKLIKDMKNRSCLL